MSCLKCTYAPEFGQTPAQECWSVFLTPEALEEHLQRWHPSRRTWPQPGQPQGIPVITLGFTREELDAMEACAWPSSVETWIHQQVTASLLEATRPAAGVQDRKGGGHG